MNRNVRATAALVVVISAVLAAAGAAAQQVRSLSARQFLASARAHDQRALGDLRPARELASAERQIRAARLDLGAALDTLGAAELARETTAAIGKEITAAVGANGRALAAPSRARMIMAVKAALGHESKAAALLGDAPHRPTIAELPIPLKPFGAFDLVVGADGHSVWVSGSDSGRVVGYSSPDTGVTPTIIKLRPGAFPHGITVGPDGAVYVTETGTNLGGNSIARLTPEGTQREFFLPAGAGGPWGITSGPDGKLWFTEVEAGEVGRLDPLTGKIVEHALPTPDSQPQGIVTGPDGALWGTEAGANRIFRMTLDGRATELRIPTPRSLPVSIVAGRGGLLWVAEADGGKILRISRAGKFREFALPGGGRPYGLASAPDGNVWFTDRGSNRVGLITPAGRIFTYPLPTPNAQPTAIVPLGPGSFAFTELVANRLGTIRFATR